MLGLAIPLLLVASNVITHLPLLSTCLSCAVPEGLRKLCSPVSRLHLPLCGLSVCLAWASSQHGGLKVAGLTCRLASAEVNRVASSFKTQAQKSQNEHHFYHLMLIEQVIRPVQAYREEKWIPPLDMLGGMHIQWRELLVVKLEACLPQKCSSVCLLRETQIFLLLCIIHKYKEDCLLNPPVCRRRFWKFKNSRFSPVWKQGGGTALEHELSACWHPSGLLSGTCL